MNVITIQYFKSPYGELIAGVFEGKLCLCDWRFRKMRDAVDKRIKQVLNADYAEGNDPLLTATQNQLNEYFAGNRKEFDLPLLFAGTDFQKQVWNLLLQIEYGSTTTYLELSEKMNNKGAIRAVAAANGANAISIIVPCHRVIGSNKELTGYAGGIPAKEKLLKLENPDFGKANEAQMQMEF